MASTAATGLSVIGTGLGITLMASQIPTMRKLWAEGDAKAYSTLPTFMTIMNCALWAGYGIFVKNSAEIYVVNLIGLCFTVWYLYVFHRFTLEAKARKRLLMVVGGIVVSLAILFFVLFGTSFGKGVPMEKRGAVVALLACGFNIVMLGSPIQSLIVAVKTLDASRVPALMVIISFFACICWASFGLLVQDYFIFTPNGIGFVLSIIQLLALGYVRRMRAKGKAPIQLPADTPTNAGTTTATTSSGANSGTSASASDSLDLLPGIHKAASMRATASASASDDGPTSIPRRVVRKDAAADGWGDIDARVGETITSTTASTGSPSHMHGGPMGEDDSATGSWPGSRARGRGIDRDDTSLARAMAGSEGGIDDSVININASANAGAASATGIDSDVHSLSLSLASSTAASRGVKRTLSSNLSRASAGGLSPSFPATNRPTTLSSSSSSSALPPSIRAPVSMPAMDLAGTTSPAGTGTGTGSAAVGTSTSDDYTPQPRIGVPSHGRASSGSLSKSRAGSLSFTGVGSSGASTGTSSGVLSGIVRKISERSAQLGAAVGPSSPYLPIRSAPSDASGSEPEGAAIVAVHDELELEPEEGGASPVPANRR